MMENRNYISWLKNNCSLLERVESLFNREWNQMDNISQRKIARCLIEYNRSIIEHILDELKV